MIVFNKPPVVGTEIDYISKLITQKSKMSGDGEYTQKCQRWFEENTGSLKTLLTPSCTHALELAALLIDIQPGDEVIMPSFTFVSTANAFVLRGAKIIFVDIRPDTQNMNEELVEAAITDKTKAIVPVHYAGVSCDMKKIMKLAEKYDLMVIEDAAQGVMSKYNDKALGAIGHLAAFSFHETKNYSSGGEGGLLLINDERFVERAEIIREKGTNRSLFFRGMVDKYSWVDIGSSYLPSDLQAAYLWAQLCEAKKINDFRLKVWTRYYEGLKDISPKLVLPSIPKDCTHNAHMFYLLTESIEVRTKLISYLSEKGVMVCFHYVPLHSSKAGAEFGEFSGVDQFTTDHSERLLRLPLWYGLDSSSISRVIQTITDFYKENT